MFWTWLYFWLSCLTMAYVLVSRRRDLLVAGVIVFLSWVMTNTVIMTKAPERAFLAYFVFDCTAFYVLALLLIKRCAPWTAVFMTATFCQLLMHLWYWRYSPPPFEYYERLNIGFWVQAAVTMLACVIPRRRRTSAWLPPRPPVPPARTEAEIKRAIHEAEIRSWLEEREKQRHG